MSLNDGIRMKVDAQGHPSTVELAAIDGEKLSRVLSIRTDERDGAATVILELIVPLHYYGPVEIRQIVRRLPCGHPCEDHSQTERRVLSIRTNEAHVIGVVGYDGKGEQFNLGNFTLDASRMAPVLAYAEVDAHDEHGDLAFCSCSCLCAVEAGVP